MRTSSAREHPTLCSDELRSQPSKGLVLHFPLSVFSVGHLLSGHLCLFLSVSSFLFFVAVVSPCDERPLYDGPKTVNRPTQSEVSDRLRIQ